MLTAMIAVDWLPANATVPIGPAAANVYPDRVGMKMGQVWPLDITMHALLISSANDAAYALAQRVSGSVTAFGPTMRYAAAEIGMKDHPVLHDPAGLDGTEGIDGGNLISAWDLAVAARDMMAEPYLAAIAGSKQYDFTGPDHVVYSLANFNDAFLDSYPGAIGVKTGLTDRAGFCVAEEAERGGRRMLAVVLDGTNSEQSATLLLDVGFSVTMSEERADPVLPALARPYPPPQPVLNRYRGYNPGPPQLPATLQQALQTKPSLVARYKVDLAALAVVAVTGAMVLLSRRRRTSRRTRPAAGPSRR